MNPVPPFPVDADAPLGVADVDALLLIALAHVSDAGAQGVRPRLPRPGSRDIAAFDAAPR